MPQPRIPEGEDWKDHATPCPNCKKPVLSEYEHYILATTVDLGWWGCDAEEELDDEE